MLIAAQRYINRPVIIKGVLNDLVDIIRHLQCEKIQTFLNVILLSMDRHPGEMVIFPIIRRECQSIK